MIKLLRHLKEKPLSLKRVAAYDHKSSIQTPNIKTAERTCILVLPQFDDFAYEQDMFLSLEFSLKS